jgi:hypothetical protein
MNRINRKLCSQDSLAFAAISLTLLIITTRNKTISVRISNTNTARFQINSNK